MLGLATMSNRGNEFEAYSRRIKAAHERLARSMQSPPDDSALRLAENNVKKAWQALDEMERRSQEIQHKISDEFRSMERAWGGTPMRDSDKMIALRKELVEHQNVTTKEAGKRRDDAIEQEKLERERYGEKFLRQRAAELAEIRQIGAELSELTRDLFEPLSASSARLTSQNLLQDGIEIAAPQDFSRALTVFGHYRKR